MFGRLMQLVDIEIERRTVCDLRVAQVNVPRLHSATKGTRMPTGYNIRQPNGTEEKDLKVKKGQLYTTQHHARRW